MRSGPYLISTTLRGSSASDVGPEPTRTPFLEKGRRKEKGNGHPPLGTSKLFQNPTEIRVVEEVTKLIQKLEKKVVKFDTRCQACSVT